MGLFETKCRHCQSKDHESSYCPHERGLFFRETMCSQCRSKEHSSNNCPHRRGIFSIDSKCKFCSSINHSSDSCPHRRGFFYRETRCKHCGSKEHSSDDCPHKRGIFYSETKCKNCGSINHSSNNCPHQNTESAYTTIISWLIGVGIIVFVILWLAINVFLPIALLNSALLLTFLALIKKENRTILSVLALIGGGYMIIDIMNCWLSTNFVNNVVKNAKWISSFVYINSIAIGLSTWFLVSPIIRKAKQLAANERSKRNILVGTSILLVIIASLLIPILYNTVKNQFSLNYSWTKSEGSNNY